MRNCLLRAISPFPTAFSKDSYCRHLKTRVCLGKAKECLVNTYFIILHLAFKKVLVISQGFRD